MYSLFEWLSQIHLSPQHLVRDDAPKRRWWTVGMTSSCKTWQILHRQEIRYLRKHSDGKPEFPATYWDLTNQYYIYSHFTDILHILGHAVKNPVNLEKRPWRLHIQWEKWSWYKLFISWSQRFLNKLYILSVMSMKDPWFQSQDFIIELRVLKIKLHTVKQYSGWMQVAYIWPVISSPWLFRCFFFWDEILPSYMGTIMIQCKDPY